VDEIRSKGGEALCIRADVADVGDVSSMFTAVESALGPVSALVNNAGITGLLGPFAKADPQSIETIMRINVLGTGWSVNEGPRRQASCSAVWPEPQNGTGRIG
jgi:NAD(P)-dependent dehydrogenase (short-subunit alcohol dehydrogenase family)